jgi:hypothetical protein
MDVAAFELAQRAAVECGLAVGPSLYSPQNFGSWFVTVKTSPRRRLVWDGKEEWYVIEEESEEMFNGLAVWRELWVEKAPTHAKTAVAIDILCGRSQ